MGWDTRQDVEYGSLRLPEELLATARSTFPGHRPWQHWTPEQWTKEMLDWLDTEA